MDNSLKIYIDNLKDVSEVVALELIAHYNEIENKIINNNQKNIEECIMMYQEILNDISLCLKQDITIEDRIKLIEKEMEISLMIKQLTLGVNESYKTK